MRNRTAYKINRFPVWAIVEKSTGAVVTRGFRLMAECKAAFNDPAQGYGSNEYEIRKFA